MPATVRVVSYYPKDIRNFTIRICSNCRHNYGYVAVYSTLYSKQDEQLNIYSDNVLTLIVVTRLGQYVPRATVEIYWITSTGSS